MESSDACNPITRAFHGSVRHLINAWKVIISMKFFKYWLECQFYVAMTTPTKVRKTIRYWLETIICLRLQRN